LLTQRERRKKFKGRDSKGLMMKKKKKMAASVTAGDPSSTPAGDPLESSEGEEEDVLTGGCGVLKRQSDAVQIYCRGDQPRQPSTYTHT